MTGGRTVKVLLAGALAAGAVVVGIGPADVARAEDIAFVVDSVLDEPGNGVPGQCVSVPSGECTLRAALTAGPATPPGNVHVTFAPAVHGQQIALQSELTFDDFGGSVLIEGSYDPSRRVILLNPPLGRILHFQGDGNLGIIGLHLLGGGVNGNGAGLLVDDAANVSMQNIEATGNQATGSGGGMAITAESLIIQDSTIRDNEAAGGSGAGLWLSYDTGMTLIERTDFSGNDAGVAGGGLFIQKDITGDTVIVSSIFDGNTASGVGGGIACAGCGPGSDLVIRDSSIVGNISLAAGGGVSATSVSTSNTTLTANQATNPGSALDAAFGTHTHSTFVGNPGPSGIDVDLSGELFIESSIIVDSCSGGDIDSNPFQSSVVAPTCTVNGTTVWTTPTFASLAGAGGTLTGARFELPVLVPTSGAGGAPCVLAIDARGVPRPATLCTYGAIEPDGVGLDQSFIVTSTADSEDLFPADGTCASAIGGCTLRAAVMESQALPSTDTIEIAAGVGPIRLTIPHCNPATDLTGRCADLDISRGSVTIVGDADGSTIGADVGRIFDLSTDVTLERLDLDGAPGGGEFGGGGLVRATPPAGKQVTIADSELHRGGGSTFGIGGGAVAFEGEGILDLHNVSFHDNGAVSGGVGGAIAVSSTAGAVHMVGVRAEGNSAQFRSAFSIRTGGQVRLTDVVVAGNTGGGAIECTCADAQLTGVSISGNTGLSTGGLIIAPTPDAWGAPVGVRLQNVNISSNAGRGGALVIGAATPGTLPVPVALEYVTVANNDGRNGSGFLGGGLLNNNLDPATRPTVTASVLANNLSDDAPTSNCRGPITVLGSVFDPLNGCAATGVDTRDPLLGSTTERTHSEIDHTFLGPVPVVEPAPSSPVVSAVECGPDLVEDVSGVARPTGGGCDAGAVEVIGISLRLFPSASSVTAAGSAVPLTALSPKAVAAPEVTVGGQTLAGPTIDGQDLRASDLQDSPLGSIPLGSIPLGSIPLGSIPLGSIPLGSIGLNKAGGWTEVLADTTLADVPLQHVTLQDVVALDPPVLGTEGEDAITLADLDLSSTPLGSIPLGSIALANLPLGSIPLGSIGGAPLDWCRDIVTPAGVPCGSGPGQVNPADPNTTLLALSLAGVPLGSIPLGSIPLGSIDLSGTPLGSIPLGSIAIDASPLGSIPLGSIDLSGVPLGSIPLGSIPLGSIPLGSIPLGSIPLGSIPLGSIPLGSIPLGSIPLGSIATASSPLGSIPLGSIPMEGTPLGSIPLGSIDLQDSPLGSIPLGSIPLGSIPLGSIPLGSIPLGSIPLGSIPLGSIPLVIECTVVDCQNGSLTLRDVAAAGGLVQGATLAQLGTYGTTTLVHLRAFAAALAGTPLGSIGTFGDTLLADLFGDDLAGPIVRGLLLSQLGAYGDASVAVLEGLDLNGDGVPDGPTVSGSGVGNFADLIPDRAEEWPEFEAALANLTLAQFLALLPPDVRAQLTLGGLLQGVIPAAEYPWEDLDLEAAGDVLADESGGLVSFVLEIESALTDSSNFTVDIQLPEGFRYVPGSLTYPGAIVSTAGTGATVTAVVEPRDGLSLLQLQARAPVTVGFRGRSAATLTTTVGANQIVATATGVDQVVSEAFEPNDTRETATTVAPGSLYLTHLASTGDVDWFKVRATTDGARLLTIVSNLAADFDVAVFGPTDPALRGIAVDSVIPAADQGRSLLKQGAVAETQVADDIDLTAPAGYELLGVSAQRGTGDEQVETTGLVRNTDYYVRITGYQGAVSTQPYALRVKFSAPPLIDGCTGTTLPAASGPSVTFPALPSDVTTLYVVHSGRMHGFYEDRGLEVDGDAVLSSLHALVTAVNGAPATFGGEVAGVLDLATIGAVQAAYATWDGDPCRPNLANGVVSAIGSALDTLLAPDRHPDVENIVLVGNDDQIPFARVRDATVYSNEREYVEGPGVRQTPLTNSLALGYLLSDDPYADASPLAVGSRELFVPDLAIGRLVEMPAEIEVALDNYVRFEGRLDPQTALSTGYDFLDDGAEEIAKALRANELGPDQTGLTTAELRGDTWDSEALDDALSGTGAAAAPDISSVNAHFDHFRAVPAASDAAGEETDLYTTGDLLDDETRPTLERSLLFSMGCHGGLSVSDLTVGGIRTNDWAQSLSGAGAVFAGNTGFGYGDTATVAASEELMLRFAENLDGTMTVGQAMSLAKQRYVAAHKVGMTPFDEKVAAQVVVYGLPQYRIGGVTPDDPTFVDTTPDPGLGLDTSTVTLGNDFDLVAAENGRGEYWTFAGDFLATAGQPVQPRAVVDVTAEDRQARGALITSLTSADFTLTDPAYTTPAVDSAATSPEVSTTPTIFPTRLQSVSSYETPTGPRDELVVIPGQFSGGGAGTGGGRQRLFTSLGASVLYAPTDGPGAGDTTEPLIGQVSAVLGSGGGVTFEVGVSDDTAVTRTTVLFIASGTTGPWTSVTLTRDGDVWRGVVGVADLPAGTEIDFIVQAADSGGNVATSTNKGAYFAAVEVGPPTIDVAGPFDEQEGWYTGPVDVTVAPFATGALVDVTVNGQAAAPDLRLEQDGVYEISASTPTGPTTSAVVRIDAAAPTISASASPSLRPSTVPIDVTLVGEDAGIGVESIRYRTTGAVVTAETEVDATTAVVTIGETGVTKVFAVAVDGLGRPSAEVEVEVEIAAVVTDVTPPTVTCGSPPTTWQRVDVVISCNASDDSGLAPDSPASFELRTSVRDGTETAAAMTDTRTICDSFNLCTTVGPFQAKVDKKAPTVDVKYPRPGEQVILRAPVSTDTVCSDAGSGVAGCAPVALSTSTLGSKTVTVTGRDVAGNVTTVTVPYTVVHLWNGYQLPILDPPLININRINRTVPVRFSISDASRRIDRDLQHVTRIVYQRYNLDGSLGPPVVLVDATRRTGLSSALLGYRYDWKTPQQIGAYRFTVTLDDGTSHHANFILL